MNRFNYLLTRIAKTVCIHVLLLFIWISPLFGLSQTDYKDLLAKSPKFRSEDEKLTKAFNQVIKEFSGEYRESIRDAQRAWQQSELDMEAAQYMGSGISREEAYIRAYKRRTSLLQILIDDSRLSGATSAPVDEEAEEAARKKWPANCGMFKAGVPIDDSLNMLLLANQEGKKERFFYFRDADSQAAKCGELRGFICYNVLEEMPVTPKLRQAGVKGYKMVIINQCMAGILPDSQPVAIAEAKISDSSHSQPISAQKEPEQTATANSAIFTPVPLQKPKPVIASEQKQDNPAPRAQAAPPPIGNADGVSQPVIRPETEQSHNTPSKSVTPAQKTIATANSSSLIATVENHDNGQDKINTTEPANVISRNTQPPLSAAAARMAAEHERKRKQPLQPETGPDLTAAPTTAEVAPRIIHHKNHRTFKLAPEIEPAANTVQELMLSEAIEPATAAPAVIAPDSAGTANDSGVSLMASSATIPSDDPIPERSEISEPVPFLQQRQQEKPAFISRFSRADDGAPQEIKKSRGQPAAPKTEYPPVVNPKDAISEQPKDLTPVGHANASPKFRRVYPKRPASQPAITAPSVQAEQNGQPVDKSGEQRQVAASQQLPQEKLAEGSNLQPSKENKLTPLPENSGAFSDYITVELHPAAGPVVDDTPQDSITPHERKLKPALAIKLERPSKEKEK